jgi:tetratricopeptide (TPR) repeat protein
MPLAVSGRTDDRTIETLRRRAERAMDEGLDRSVVEPILERLLRATSENDPSRLFAHRHLAELCLEENPWRAAIHLRKVIAARANDDVAHSLMGLAQSLLGNYQSAVASYRRAVAIEPGNPWYRHNLGHILDVALDQPRVALPHLELALAEADSTDHEVFATVAHCLARIGQTGRALTLARAALAAAPRSREHRALLAWIEAGAPTDRPGWVAETSREAPAAPHLGATDGAERDPVVEVLERGMRTAHCDEREVAAAHRLWVDYQRLRGLSVKRPEIYAAAVHYAIGAISADTAPAKAAIAERYGVAPKTLARRFIDIQRALRLETRDPRYTS